MHGINYKLGPGLKAVDPEFGGWKRNKWYQLPKNEEVGKIQS